MSAPEDWELQLAALLRTADLSSVVESLDPPLDAPRSHTGPNSSSPRSLKHPGTDGASGSEHETEPRRKAIWKATKEPVQVISYEMDANGARKCIREAIFLKRPVVLAQPSLYRGLSHIVQPLGVWTSSNSPLLYLVLKQSGINSLAKVLECNAPLPTDLLRTILKGVLSGLDLCHQNGISHCAIHPDAIFLHTCASKEEDCGACNDNCDFGNNLRRGNFPASPVVAQISRFENSIEFVPNISDVSHLPNMHKRMPAFWTAPELCAVITKPKSKIRRRNLRESGGKVDIWSVGILTLTLIERNMVLSQIAPRNRDSLSTIPLRDLTPKQVGRLAVSPKIIQQRKWTTLAQDFVTSCLRIEPSTRPTAAFLLKHPFLTNAMETCLLSYSDVSESEASPLEETYDDSTTYIPAPDSDSMGHSGEESWSEDEDPPHSGRSNTASVTSFNDRRISSDDPDYHYRTGSFQPGSQEDQLGSSEASDSGGSVVIIDSDDDSNDRTPPDSAKGFRKRGKSDAAKDELMAASEYWLKPLDFSNLEVRTRAHPTASQATASNYKPLPKGTPRRNSEFLRTASASVIETPRGDPDSPPGGNNSLIAVHTHKQPTLKGSHDSERASRRFQSTGQHGSVHPLGANIMPRDSLPNTPTTGRAPSRERTPSPAKHAINSVPLSPGRRSSLPLLPLTSLTPPRDYPLPTPVPAGGQISKNHHHHHHHHHHHRETSGSSVSKELPSAHGALSPNVTSPQTPEKSPSDKLPPSVFFSPTSSSSSGSNSNPHTPPPLSPHLSPHSTSPASPHYTTATSKASTMVEKEPFKPALLSKSMRSRSEDILIDKDGFHQLQARSSSGSPSHGMGRSPSGSMMPTASNSSSLTTSSPNTAGTKKKKLKKRITDSSGAPTAPAAPAVPVSTPIDDAFLMEMADCEMKWMQEIKKRNKAIEGKEKEVSDKTMAKLRSVRKRYDAQILAITKRDEARYADLKHRIDEEKTKLMTERQRELDRVDLSSAASSVVSAPGNRRNSFSGISSSLIHKKPQFPKRILHINHEKSVYEMDRKHVLERQEIELRTLDDTSLIDREFELQKYLVEQSQLETLQEIQRQHLEDVHSLKVRMNEELKIMTRKHVARKSRKLIEASKPLGDETAPEFAWPSLLSCVSPRPSTADPLGAALSLIEVSVEQLAPPPEVTTGLLDRFHRSVELQSWRQDEEVQSLSRDIRLVEDSRRDAEAMNRRHQQEILDLKNGFEAHYVRTRQSFMTDRINRINQYELELVDLKYQHMKRMVSKADEVEARAAESQIAALHDADYAILNHLYMAKRQQLSLVTASLIPNKVITPSSSSGQIHPASKFSDMPVASYSTPDLPITDLSDTASPRDSEPGSF